MELLLGFAGGIAVALGIGVLMKKRYKRGFEAIFDLDWDMDGESGEFIAKVKQGQEYAFRKLRDKLKD